MNESLDVLKKGVGELIVNINYHEELDKVFESISKLKSSEMKLDKVTDNFISNVLPSANINKKKFLYKSSIITTYGLLECYVEGLVEEYVKAICSIIDKYSDIPQEISEKHIFNTYDLLKSYSKKRAFSQIEFELKQKDLIKNIHGCLNDQNDFIVNESAFSLHSSNFRYDSINKIFSDVGLSNVLVNVAKSSKVKDLIKKEKGISEEAEIEESTASEIIRNELDDLAQRRNEIAHGFENEDIQSSNFYESRAKFILTMCEALYDTVYKNFNRIRSEKKPGLAIACPTNYFKGPNVLGFSKGIKFDKEVLGKELKVGDTGYFSSDGAGYSFCIFKILGIIKEGNNVKVFKIEHNTEFALKIDAKLPSRITNRIMNVWL